jgi:hypothetical protein
MFVCLPTLVTGLASVRLLALTTGLVAGASALEKYVPFQEPDNDAYFQHTPGGNVPLVRDDRAPTNDPISLRSTDSGQTHQCNL